MSATRIQLLGRLAVIVDGHEAVFFRPSFPSLLLACLAVKPHSVTTRDTLVRQLWPDDDLGNGRARLRITLKRLTDQLPNPGIILAERDEVSLDWSRVSSDLQNLPADSLPLLEQFDEDWICELRAEVAIRQRELQHQFALQMASEGDIRAVGLLESCLKSEQSNSTLLVAWAKLLTSAGESGPAILQRAERLVGTAGAEILRQRLQFVSHRDDSFVGRGAELVQLAKLSESSRLVTITGVGGAGKTRLAMEFAANQGEFVAVDLTDADSESDVVSIFTRTLGLSDDGLRPVYQEIGRMLDVRKILVVVDNCEHIVQDTACVLRRILELTTRVRFLATSRCALGLAREKNLQIAGFEVKEGGSDSEAMQFFARCASKVNSKLSTADLEPAKEIIQSVDGLPLGIELATAQLRKMSLLELVAQLRDDQTVLTSRSAPARHRSLEEVIAWSIHRLSAEANTVLNVCSIFAGGFTKEALQAVTQIGTHELNESLIELEEFALVRNVPTRFGKRFGILETVKVAAAGQLATSPEHELYRRRHVEFFAEKIERLDVEYAFENGRTSFDVLGQEFPNAIAAMNWATTDMESAGIGLELATSLWTYWDQSLRFVEASHYYSNLIDAAERAGYKPERVGKACMINGRMLTSQGRHSEAVAFLERGSEMVSSGTNTHLKILARTALARDSEARGDYKTAEAHLLASIELGRGDPDPLPHAANSAALGNLFSTTGDHANSRRWNLEAIASFGEIKQHHHILTVLATLADNERALGMLAEARRRLESTISIAEQSPDVRHLYATLHNLAEVHMEMGELDAAEELFKKVAEMRADPKMVRSLAITLRHLGSLYCVAGKYDLALENINRAYKAQIEAKAIQSQAVCEHWMARVHLEQGRLESAREILVSSLTKLQVGENRSQIAKAIVNASHLALRTGSFEEARLWLVSANLQEVRMGHAVMWYDKALRARIACELGATLPAGCRMDLTADVVELSKAVVAALVALRC